MLGSDLNSDSSIYFHNSKILKQLKDARLVHKSLLIKIGNIRIC